MTDRQRKVWIATIAGSAATFVLVTVFAFLDPGPKPPTLAYLPAFSLTDQRSAVVTNETLHGRPFVAAFFFSTCPYACPKLMARMAVLQRAIREKNLPVHLVSFSVDPDNDTPPVLAAYAARFSADVGTWSFLTGKNDALERAFLRGYEISCRKPDQSGASDISQIMHGDWLVLVDGEGRVRGFYDSRERGQMTQVLADAERVARDPSLD